MAIKLGEILVNTFGVKEDAIETALQREDFDDLLLGEALIKSGELDEITGG